MSERTVKENAEALALRALLKYLESNPEENIPHILDWIARFYPSLANKGPFAGAKKALQDKNGIWYKYVVSLFTDIDPHVRQVMFENFVVNSNLIGGPVEEKTRAENNCSVPWAILMDPTSACNLHCTGCWAAEYSHQLNLSLDNWDSIIEQGKAMGTYMYIYTGGEPLVRKHDIIKMCEKHHDCMFLAFTNSTLIDEEFANDMLRVGNFVPAISVEGFEEATDSRRGKGTYAKVVKAMELLKSKKLPFGVSCCYTSQNVQDIGSEAYFDWMVKMGCKFCWLFTFMPVGVGAPTELMVSAEQRAFMYRQVRAFRKTKPLFTMDFWNDGEFVGGCIAGGRRYLHINANGDIEPCAFIHYSDSNIKDKTLLQAYQSPLFMAYHNGQPFSDNLLRPCPLLDNPNAISGMVDASGAHSTDMMDPEEVHSLSSKCEKAAEAWKPTADELWTKSGRVCHDCTGCAARDAKWTH